LTCKNNGFKNEEPVFITKNGKGDLAVMSIETYEKFCSRAELYRLLEEGLADEKAGRVRPFREAIADIRKGLDARVSR
jgi:prevent-host-death family protein